MIRVLLTCLFIASSTHDIHYSKSTIDYNEETSTLQIVINVFTDDLEFAIERTREGLDLEIGADNQHESTDSLVADYVLDKLTYTNSSEDVGFEYIGLEYDYDICYLYLESEAFDLNDLDKHYLSVQIFQEIYADQDNAVDLRGRAQHISLTEPHK